MNEEFASHIDLEGPLDPSVLTTDDSMLHQAKDARKFLIEHFEKDGDTSGGHMAHCYTLKAAIGYLIFSMDAADQHHKAQEMLLRNAESRIEHLSNELKEVQRPLDDQMRRLNERVIELQANLDAVSVIPEKRRLIAKAHNWDTLMELCGSWQDGSDQKVTLSQDDATRTCSIMARNGLRTIEFYGEGQGFESAIAEVRKVVGK